MQSVDQCQQVGRPARRYQHPIAEEPEVYPEVQPVVEVQEEAAPVVRRSVGRPRRIPLAEVEVQPAIEVQEEAAPVVRRPVGRPRRIPVAEVEVQPAV